MTELEVNGTLIDDKADNVHVNLSTAQEVVLKRSDSDDGVLVWQRTANLPEPITDFEASNNLENFITCTFTVGSLTDRTDLYDYDTQTLIAENITTGYQWSGAELGVMYNLCIVSINAEGIVISNVDSGNIIQHGDVTIDYDSISGSNPETVTGGNGSFVFNAPAWVSEVSVCLTGGGGSGATYRGNAYIHIFTGGGYAGEFIQNSNVSVNGNVDIVVGKGAPSYTGVAENGSPGGQSSFGDIIANGGNGGVWREDDTTTPFHGNGETIDSPCSGSFTNGISTGNYVEPGNYAECRGGQASAFGNGTDGGFYTASLDAGISAGSGGVVYSNTDYVSVGSGGDGRIVISW